LSYPQVVTLTGVWPERLHAAQTNQVAMSTRNALRGPGIDP